MQFKTKQTLIASILKPLKPPQNFKLFATFLLQKMSVRTLHNLDIPTINCILKNGFEFLSQSLKEKKPNIKFSFIDSGASWVKNKTVLEIVCPDATQLLLTIETILKEHKIRMSRKLHPVYNIHSQQDTFTIQENSCLDSQKYTYIFISFSTKLDTHEMTKLKKKLDFHIKTIQLIENDRLAIHQQVDSAIQLSQQQYTHGIKELSHLLYWLRHANFSFFGFMNSKTQLGLCSKTFLKLDPSLQPVLEERTKQSQNTPFVFDTIGFKSPVYRFENMMCLSIQLPNYNENLFFFGLLRRSSLLANNLETPIIKNKLDYIFNSHQVAIHSYDYSEIVRIFSGIPKYELFRTSKEDLLDMVENLLNITNHNHIQCFYKVKPQAKQAFMLVAVPTYLFTQDNIQKILNHINLTLPLNLDESIEVQGPEICRLHLYFSMPNTYNLIEESLERQLSHLLRDWTDQALDHITKLSERNDVVDIKQNLLPLIPEHYVSRTSSEDIASDILTLKQLNPSTPYVFKCLPFSYPKSSDLCNKASLLKLFSLNKIDLIEVMPIFDNIGLHVIDQLTARIGNVKQTLCYIQSFRVQTRKKEKISLDHIKENLQELLGLIFRKKFENGPLNALVLQGFKAKQIQVFKLYCSYFKQLDPSINLVSLQQSLLDYPEVTKTLWDYFYAKFDIKSSVSRSSKNLVKLEQQFTQHMQTVQSIEDDFFFKQLLNLIKATLRTTFFNNSDYVYAIKINPSCIELMPTPVPYREIFVYGSSLEGVHFRFGKLARGGLRFSDRNSDFRREILSLVQTQRVKNVVIVPNGAKGGFVIKHIKKPDFDTIASHYKTFIDCLLSITDNYSASGKEVSAKNCICHDEFDPYLVVAADKGTATFSDLANEIALKHNFWLGDAFASGGQFGYDHKKYGITAKGAWACFEQHCIEQNLSKSQALTCVGIGDMAGDVFGNGLLLSKRVKLVAAFNHMHIFIDPDPCPEKSWNERNRLFNLEKSTWKDYKALSIGGGVFDRQAKSIALSPEIQACLNIDEQELSGPELIKVILKQHVDFIWFGGIGTYIKSPEESHLQIGDTSNDSVRINADECQARIISEGANLGLSTKARINYAVKKGAINTDAIDNSAGVNMSDYEVNLKILFQKLKEKNIVSSLEERNVYLDKMGEEVTELVLNNNRLQHKLISFDAYKSQQKPEIFLELIYQLSEQKILNLTEESLPSLTQIKRFSENGQGIPRPILAILQAYVKQTVFDTILNSDLSQNSYFSKRFYDYFPDTVLKKFHDHLDAHPLKHEITTLEIVNEVINRAGTTCLFELQRNTNQDLDKIISTYILVNDLLNAESLRQQIDKEDISAEARFGLLNELDTALKKVILDLLQAPLSSVISLDHFDTYNEISKKFQQSFKNKKNLDLSSWLTFGISEELAKKFFSLSQSRHIPELIYFKKFCKASGTLASKLIIHLSDELHLDFLDRHLFQLNLKSHWEYKQSQELTQMLFHNKMIISEFIYQLAPEKTLSQFSLNQRLKLAHPEINQSIQDYKNEVQFLQKNPEQIELLSLNVCASLMAKTVSKIQLFKGSFT